jgi:hypothetical protein
MKKPTNKSFSLLVLSVLFLFLASALSAKAEPVTLHLSLNNSDAQNRQLMQEQLADKAATSVAFEFSDAFAGQALFFSTSATPTESYDKNYPNGDFYYLIGDLSNRWGKSDYGAFYDTAKMLALRGFRTVINVNADTSDVREAVQNPRTSAIIWNSHGSDDGAVYDKKDNALPKDTFVKDKSSRLRFVLFANCYGYTSIDYYQIGGKTLGIGWQEETSSPEFFSYLKSNDFLRDLKKAFGHLPRK